MAVPGQASAAVGTLLDGHFGSWVMLASAMVALFLIDLAVACLFPYSIATNNSTRASERNAESERCEPLELPL